MGVLSTTRKITGKILSNLLFFLTFRLFFLCLCVFLVVLSSIGLYSIFYYLTVPKPEHLRDVHLQHSKDCSRKTGELLCHFPFASIPLSRDGIYSSETSGKVFALGQGYKIVLELDMPPSEVNKAAGMFSIELALVPNKGEKISSLRSVMLPYRSPISRFIKTVCLSGLYLLNLLEEKETIERTMFENFRDNTYEPIEVAEVTIHARHIEIDAVRLRIRANFQGLRYFMFYWPITSASIGILAFLSLLSLVGIWIYVKCAANAKSSRRNRTPYRRFPTEHQPEARWGHRREAKLKRSRSMGEVKETEKGKDDPLKDALNRTVDKQESDLTRDVDEFVDETLEAVRRRIAKGRSIRETVVSSQTHAGEPEAVATPVDKVDSNHGDEARCIDSVGASSSTFLKNHDKVE